MTCEQTPRINAYHDGALSPADRAAVEQHLAACGECRELLADLKHLSSLFATVPLPEMPQRAMSRMYGSWWKYQNERDHGVRRLAGWLTAAAAAVLVLVPLTSPSSTKTRTETDAPWVDTIAFVVPAEQRDTPNADLVQVATWMANDLSNGQR